MNDAVIAKYRAARRAAIQAHESHFGTNNAYRIVPNADEATLNAPPRRSSDPSLIRTSPTPPPTTYAVNFLPSDPSESIGFQFQIPSDFPSDQAYPIQCTATDCPVQGFHYQGLYMIAGQVAAAAAAVGREDGGAFGHSEPPAEVWEALERLARGEGEQGDEDVVQGFRKWHFWKGGERNLRWTGEGRNGVWVMDFAF